jgi:DNA-binding cell septation regulator SpoVG
MDIRVKWFDGQYPSFNVSIASNEQAEEFLSIKGCRIVSGNNGEFVSWPATKNEKSGKYWNHVWANEKFSAAVLAKAKATAPAAGNQSKAQATTEEDVPF